MAGTAADTRYAQFIEIVRARLPHLGPDAALDPDAPLVSLGLNSMEQVGLLIDVESFFDVTVPDEFLVQETFASAGSLWAVVAPLVP